MNTLNQFLTTGQQPTTAREKSALLDQCRDKLLTTNQQTNQMQPKIKTSMTAEFMTWKRTHPDGTAQQFIAHKTKPSPTIAAHAGALDPDSLPRLDNGKIDSLAITNLLERQKAAELKIASDAISRKNPPRKSFVGKPSQYTQPD